MNEMMHFPDTVEEFMELFKVIDSDHVYSNGIEFVPIFRMQQWFEHLKAKPKTEGDKIRAMTDEELASEMSDIFNEHCLRCPVLKADCHGWETRNSRCYDAMLDWLKQPATE